MIYQLLCCFFVFVLGYFHWTTAEPFDLADETVFYLNNLDRTINTSINPCDDFQAYVCSGGKNEHFNNSNVIDKRINKLITGPRPVADGTAINKMYDFYELCKKNQKMNMLKKSLEKLDRFLKDIKFDKAEDVTPQIFAEVIAYLAANHNIKLFMDIKFDKSPTRAGSEKSENILNVKWPHVWDKNYVYEELPEDLFQLSDDEVFDMYVRPYNLMNSFETTVKGAMIEFPGIDWVRLINKLSTSTGTNMTVNCSLMNCALYFQYPRIINGVSEIMGALSPAQFKNYIQIKIKEALKNNGNDNGLNCFNLVESTFSPVLSRLLFKEAYQTSAKGGTQKRSKASTTLKLLISFRDMLEKLPNIKDNTEPLSYVNDKIRKVAIVIAVQKTFIEKTWLDKEYKDFVIEKGDTFDLLYFKAQRNSARRSIEEYNRDFYDHETDVLRHYPAFLLAADLANPYFTPDDIPAITYGALGALIGNQIIHKSSNFFNNYDEREFEVNWMQAAYDAFISDPKSRGSVIPKTLKLSNLTNQQLFFLLFGKHWCRSDNSQISFNCSLFATHNAHFHMLDRLRNFAPFREAFNCAVSTKHVTEKQKTTEIPKLTLSTTTSKTTTPKPTVTKPVHLAAISTSTTISSGKAPIIVGNDLKHAPEQRSHNLFTSNLESKVASKTNTAAKPIGETTMTSDRNVSTEALTNVTTDKPTSEASTAFIGNMVSLLLLLSFTI